MVDISRIQSVLDTVKRQNDLLEIRLMRHRARQAAKYLRPIEGFFWSISRPLPRTAAERYFIAREPLPKDLTYKS